MAIDKRPSGKWRSRLQINGKQVSKTFDTKTAAKDWEAIKLAEKAKGEFISHNLGAITLSEWFASWMALHNVRQTTKALYESTFKLHVEPILGDSPIGDITPTVIREWFTERIQQSTKPAVEKAYRVLKACLQAAVDDERISSNPCNLKGKSTDEAKDIRPLTTEELWQLSDAMTDRFQVAVLVMGYGGLRVSECMGLEVQDWNSATQTLSVTKQIGKDLQFSAPKTKAGVRKVGLPSFVAERVDTHIEQFCNGPESPLFPTSEGGWVGTDNFRFRDWKKAVKVLDWTPTPHDLRHTCASLAIEAGVDVKNLANMLGHSRASITLDIYAHLMPGNVEAVVAKMEALKPPTMS